MPFKTKSKKPVKRIKKKQKKLFHSKKRKVKQNPTSKTFSRKKVSKKVVFKSNNLISPQSPSKKKEEQKLLKPAIKNELKTPTFLKEINLKEGNARISAYILDLKTILAEKDKTKEKENTQAQIISSEIINKLGKKTDFFYKKFGNFYQRFKNNFHFLRPKIKIEIFSNSKAKIIENKKSLKIPQISGLNLGWQPVEFQPKEIRLGNLIIPTYWKKTFFGFLIFCLIFVAPFQIYSYYQNLQGKKNEIFQKTSQALWHLAISQKAASAQDLYYTGIELQAASQNFSQAKNDLENINFLLQEAIKLVPQLDKQFITAQKLVAIGEKLSKSAATLTLTLNKINFEDSVQKLNLTEKLIILKDNLNLILPDLKTANLDLQQIYLDRIPQQYQQSIQKIQSALPLLEKEISTFIDYSDSILKFLGQDHKKRYLVLFQNNHEIRPTGGFIGSYALINIDKGNIEKIDIPGGGPYDLKAGLKVNIKSPSPLNLLNPRWEFQDANWFADLPTSAEKLIWFYEKSGGSTVDGLIFINATFIQNLLKILGPVELPDYKTTITNDNFFSIIQENVELKYDKKLNQPKQIIADLTPKILNHLLHSDKKQFLEIFDLILNSLKEKEIQFYFSDYTLEKLVLDNNWGGQLKNTDRDYLEIVSTNIAGEKTDAKIEQLAHLEVNVQSDGSIINTLKITKTHNGKKDEIFYGVPNLDYLRIYVPKGSELLAASGFSQLPEELFTISETENFDIDPDLAFSEFSRKSEPISKTIIYNENNKTVFANWLKIEPGQSQTVTLQYKLPFKLNIETENNQLNLVNIIKEALKLNKEKNSDFEKYSLLWQKQSGKKNYQITAQIKFPKNLNYQIVYPDNLTKKNNIFIYKDSLNTDKSLAIIYGLK